MRLLASVASPEVRVRSVATRTTGNAPYGVVQESLFHELFPKQHPYYGEVIGSHADIEAARLKDVRQFFEQLRN